MKLNKRLVVWSWCFLVISIFLFVNVQANVIKANGSGNWNSTVNDAPWPNGVVPTSTDSVMITANHKVTITADASCITFKIKPHVSGGADTSKLTINSGITFSVEGEFKIDKNNGTRKALVDCQGTIKLQGEFVNDGNFDGSNSKIEFIGSGNQSFNGIVSTAIHDLVINTGGDVTLNKTLVVNGTLTLSSGNLITTLTSLLIIEDVDDPGISGGGLLSHIIGPVIKKYTSTTAITFPLGNGTRYMPIVITPETSTEEHWQVEFKGVGHVAYGICAKDPLGHVSTMEYWNINRESGNNVDARIKLFWDDSSLVDESNISDLRIAHYDSASSCWEAGNKAVSTDITSNFIVTNTALKEFSPFTFGSINSNHPLPIELIDFSAARQDYVVVIKWTTAIEINNDFYTIERSNDGLNFEEIMEVNGAGNSNSKLDYSLTDEYPLDGMSYYRLKQTDYDGKFSYSEMVYVRSNNSEAVIGNIYFNNSSNELNVMFEVEDQEMIELSCYDMRGKMVVNEMLEAMKGENEIFIDLESISSGIYFTTIRTNSTQWT
ncbi:T9SS type A sorting domain-containing protein, partial [Sphingobacteriaceae bacterium AH-315-L07]|nr:T9SS type A sorting domain-containing protein [Sphingobacteriaceae bacterium AH-315-L07]